MLDAAGFFAALQLTIVGKVFTVKEVLDEVRDEASRRSLEMTISAGKIVLGEYGPEDLQAIKEVARSLGELGRLSDTDLKILALTHNLLRRCQRVIVVSDDRSVQNVSLAMGAEVIGVKRPVLKRPRKYVYLCPSCGRVLEEPGTCPYCGTELKRTRYRGH